MPTRDEFLLAGLDRSSARGIELGPFYAPLAPKAEGWNTWVIDSYDTVELRRRAFEHDDAIIRGFAHRVEDVDVVWGGEPLDQVPALVAAAPFDYVVGRHVLEHAPDLLAFLRSARNLISDTGVIAMAIPDSRYCFDIFRPLTGLPAVLAAHRMGRTRHFPEVLLEQIGYCMYRGGVGAWVKSSREPLTLMGNLAWANTNYLSAIEALDDPSSEYVDAHAWVFVPASFELLLLELRALGLLDLTIDAFDSGGEASEFLVRMRPSDERPEGASLESRRFDLMVRAREELKAAF